MALENAKAASGIYNDDWFSERLTTLDGSDGPACVDAYLILTAALRNRTSIEVPRVLTTRAYRFAEATIRHLSSAPAEGTVVEGGPAILTKSGEQDHHIAFAENGGGSAVNNVNKIKNVATTNSKRLPPGAMHPDLALAGAALRFAGYLMSNRPVADNISEALRTKFFDVLIDCLKDCKRRDKTTITLMIWCLHMASFTDTLAMRADDVIAALEIVRKANFQSVSIEHESIRCYLRLFQVAEEAMKKHALLWGITTLQSMLSTAPGLRKEAALLIDRGEEHILDAASADDVDFAAILDKNKILTSLKQLKQCDGGEVIACKACGLVVAALGRNLKEQTSLDEHRKRLSELASVISKYFMDKRSSHVVTALGSWSQFVTALMQGHVSAKIIKFLLKPLSDDRFSQQWVVNSQLQRMRIEVWHLLVTNLDPTDMEIHFDLAVLPLLEACFTKSQTRSGEPIVNYTAGLEELSCIILATVLKKLPLGANSDVLSSHYSFITSCLKVILVTMKQRAGSSVNGIAVTARNIFECLCIRFGKIATSAQTSRDSRPDLFIQLLSLVIETRREQSPESFLQQLKILLEHTPSPIVTAPACKLLVNGATCSPIDVISGLLFSDYITKIRDEDFDFNLVFDSIVAGACAGSTGLHGIATILRHIGIAYDRIGKLNFDPVQLFTYWIKLSQALHSYLTSPGRATYEGSDYSPDFSAIVDVLAFPFERVQVVPFWRLNGFLEAWDQLLSTFCLESDVVNKNFSHPHLLALSKRLTEMNLRNILKTDEIMLEEVFPIYCQLVGSILGHITFGKSRNRKADAVVELVEEFAGLCAGIIGICNELISQQNWDPTSSSYFASFMTAVGQFLRNAADSGIICSDAVVRLFVPISTKIIKHSCDQQRTDTCTAVKKYWKGLSSFLANCDHEYFDSDSLVLFAPLFELTIVHSISNISAVACDLWNTTFGSTVWLGYPDELELTIARYNSKAPKTQKLKAPGWVGDTSTSSEVSESSVQVLDDNESAQGPPVRPIHTARRSKRRTTFLGTNLGEKSSSRRKVDSKSIVQSVEDDNIHLPKYVSIPTSPMKHRVLTEHQKEMKVDQRERRREIHILFEEESIDTPIKEEACDTPNDGICATAEETPKKQRTKRPIENPIVSILKRKRGPRDDDDDIIHSSSKKVSFNLTANLNYVVERDTTLASLRKSEFLVRRSGKSRKSVVKDISALMTSPPPRGLSPMVSSKPKRPKLHLDGIDRLALSPLQPSAKRRIVTGEIGEVAVSSTSVLSDGVTHRSQVQRNLEPSFSRGPIEFSSENQFDGLPSPGDIVFDGLKDCNKPVSQVINFFNANQRRGVNQLLAARKVSTVGDICCLKREDFAALPLRMRRATKSDLESYMKALAVEKATTPSPLSQIGQRVTNSFASRSKDSPSLESPESFKPVKRVSSRESHRPSKGVTEAGD